jgi:hypothetical protein
MELNKLSRVGSNGRTIMEPDTPTPKPGYYTVNLDIDGRKIPYIVFAKSQFQAAHKVKQETGYLATDMDVEGPYQRF